MSCLKYYTVSNSAETSFSKTSFLKTYLSIYYGFNVSGIVQNKKKNKINVSEKNKIQAISSVKPTIRISDTYDR